MGNINSEQLSLLEQQLAESQAREKVRINALAIADHAFRHPDDDWKRDVDLRAQKVVGDALFMPADDTALKAVLAAEREKHCPLYDAADIATKAMRKAWQLGQTYWQQADSESYRQNAKSAITQDAFNDLLDSTADAIRALENE